MGRLDLLKEYSYILIDIDLSINSHLDGYQLIENIIKTESLHSLKIIILTGQIEIENKLRQRKLPQFSILYKPLVFSKIKSCFEEAKIIAELLKHKK